MRLIRHLLPLLSAIILGTCIIFFYKKNFVKVEIPIVSDFSLKYNPNYGTGNKIVSNIANSLNTGNKIVIFGSSELANQNDSTIPYHFFNDKFKIPVVGIGHAGNQAFSIFSQLAFLNNQIINSKSVIILSPGWMYGDAGNGTSLSCFFEYMTEPMLYKIYHDNNIPEDFKLHIAKYIHHHYNELGFVSPLLELWNLKYLRSISLDSRFRYSMQSVVLNWQCNWNKFILQQYNIDFIKSDSSIFPNSKPEIINWDSLQNIGFQNEKNKCTNEFAVNDKYYKENCINKLPRIVDEPLHPNQELEDIEMLIKICVYYKIKPLFIIQPLNPYAYSGLEKLNTNIRFIDSTLNKNGFTVLNLWIDKKSDYRNGTLTDIMHLGELGWYKVDQAIYNYFLIH